MSVRNVSIFQNTLCCWPEISEKRSDWLHKYNMLFDICSIHIHVHLFIRNIHTENYSKHAYLQTVLFHCCLVLCKHLKFILKSWKFYFQTIPFIAALFPILLVYRIRSSHVSRVTIIKTFTKTKQTQEEHIKQLKNVWNWT